MDSGDQPALAQDRLVVEVAAFAQLVLEPGDLLVCESGDPVLVTLQSIEQDTCKALELWQKSAKYRRLAALISLPRHYLRGDFDECGVEIPAADLRAYLEEAKRVSSDYYVGMLADELLADIPADE